MPEEAGFLPVEVLSYITPDKLSELLLVPFGDGRVYMMAVSSGGKCGLLVKYLDTPRTPGVYREDPSSIGKEIDGDILLSFSGKKEIDVLISILSGIRDLVDSTDPSLVSNDDSDLLF